MVQYVCHRSDSHVGLKSYMATTSDKARIADRFIHSLGAYVWLTH